MKRNGRDALRTAIAVITDGSDYVTDDHDNSLVPHLGHPSAFSPTIPKVHSLRHSNHGNAPTIPRAINNLSRQYTDNGHHLPHSPDTTPPLTAISSDICTIFTEAIPYTRNDRG